MGRRELFLNKRKDLKDFEIGRWSYGDLTVLRYRRGGTLKIGSFCSFAANTVAMLGGDHSPKNISTYPFGVLFGGVDENAHASTKGDIIIGNDVWLGHSATILSGVRVGDGAVIGAHAVVSKDVPPYAIVVGNPARVVKFRFTSDVINQLLELRWWNWPDDKIRQFAPKLLGTDISEFIASAKQ
jgi:virginiamycin A acetyltransferase